MMRKKRLLRAAALGLAFSLTVCTSAFADVTVSPLTGTQAGGQQNSQTQGSFPGDTSGQAGVQGPGAQSGTGTQFETGTPSGNTGTQAGNAGTQAGSAGTLSGNAGTPSGNTGSSPGTTGTGSYLTRLPAVTATVTTTSDGTAGGSQTGGNTQTGGSQAGGNTQTSGNTAGGTERPTVESQGAVLYDATHNQFLFEQNADTRFYPASITKLMTALLVLEHSSLTDTVTFSQSAVTNLESGAVTLKLAAGDQLSVKDCMYGLLLKSANEIANGLAEHVSGSVSAFADLMNQKAAALGCTNTHFVNPNGLNNSNHYTTPRDMALIAKAAFENPTLCQIDSTISYAFPATSQAPTVRSLTMGHKMLNPANAEYYYNGVVGGKTGYTSLAGNTLVTCAERNGVRLIAVVMKAKQTHYADTKALLDYGFALQQAGAGTSTGSAAGPSGNSGSAGSSPSSSGSAGNSGTGSPAAVNGNKWAQDTAGWRFVKADGSYAKNECLIINNELYCFKEDQYMVTNNWHSIDGIWYYFRPSGGLAKSRWVQTGGYWYYVDENGSLVTNSTTPDGFTVDGNGVWVQ